MKTLIENFSKQLYEAIQIGKKASLHLKSIKYTQVVVSGLGGSGIGASIVQEYVFDKLNIPYVVNKDYFIPKSVNATTLFIACSYSGNTEETIQAFKFALKAKATIVCVTSGGELAELANKHKCDLILIPGGMPPRACLGYSMVQLLSILKAAKLLNARFEVDIENGIQLIEQEKKSIHKLANKLAAQLLNKQIAIYGIAGREALSIRFRQQLNENSKVLAWHNVIPEMTHNEIVGWTSKHEDLAVLFFYHTDDYPKNIKRLKILQGVVKKYTKNVSSIVLKGSNFLERAIYFIHLTDWISFYLADLNHQNITQVKVIDHLKKEMSKN